jgi:AcrR family transcriptional regulator
MSKVPAGEQDQKLDPRIRRTRKMLQDALASLLKEKDFDKISIGDIAERSTLNRATFYDHYPDKFALLECLVAAQFQDLIARRDIRFNGCGGAIRNLAMGVCYYLSETTPPSAEASRQASTPMETAIVAVVRRMLIEGFTQHPPRPGISIELLSSAIAWAIYGAAKEWALHPRRISVPKISEKIDIILKPMLA